MIQKKGLSYVDWVISLGTFLVAVIFIFILIKPQFERGEEKETLLRFVENGLYGEIEWTIREVPLFVELLKKEYVTNTGAVKPAGAAVHYDAQFMYTVKLDPGSHLQVVDGNPVIFQCTIGECRDEKVTLIFAPQAVLSTELPDLQMRCIPQDITICDAVLGATTTITGLHPVKLAGLDQTGYDILKQRWNYPLHREFALYKDDALLIGGSMPPPQTPVYVKERMYWTLTKDNQRTPVKLRFQVW